MRNIKVVNLDCKITTRKMKLKVNYKLRTVLHRDKKTPSPNTWKCPNFLSKTYARKKRLPIYINFELRILGK